MKYICIFIFLSCCQSLYSQLLKGKILNEQGQSIEYVNISIVGTNKGTISDKGGNFVLNISNLKPTDSLYFSHLNYHTKSLTIKEALAKEVVLTQREIELPAVEVQGKRPKLTTIRPMGMRVPNSTMFFKIREERENEVVSTAGDIITLKKDFIAKKFKIFCIKNTMQKAILRLNFYKKEENNLTPLIAKPIYILY